MRRFVGIGLIIVGCVVGAGCHSVPVVPTEGVSTVVSSLEPTPQWSVEEQGAIDAVYAYLEKWTYISQNLQETSLWATIRDVTTEPLVDGLWKQWEAWYLNGWHFVGGPEYEVVDVPPGSFTQFGSLYHVRGCFILGSGHLVDGEGNPTGQRGQERQNGYYIVLHAHDGSYFVSDYMSGEGTC